MNNPFRLKSVPASISAEITARQGGNGIRWTAKRYPWVKTTSMSDACSSKYNLTSLSGNLYETGYQRPLPVITEVSVKKQGELGTTKRATVKITAFTDEQLIELQKCYFIPGMSVRVEWGWSESAAGTGVSSPISGVQSDIDATKAIQNYTKTNPCYDGLQGIVANFTYSLTRDNYWDCSAEIIAAAEAISTTKANTYECPSCIGTVKKEDGSEIKVHESDLYSFFRALFDDFAKAKAAYTGELSTAASKNGKSVLMLEAPFNAPKRDKAGNSIPAFYEGSFLGLKINQPDTIESFISWSTLEAAINRFCLPTVGGNYVYGRMGSKTIPITYFSCGGCYEGGSVVVQSSDPRVCILPGLGDSLTTAPVSAPSCLGVDANGKPSVILDNILINATFLMYELKNVEQSGDGSLRTFLLNVLGKINDVCGGLWAFEVVSATGDPEASEKYPVLTVVDTKKYGSTSSPFVVPATATNSVIREIKLDMKMTDSMKSQALYSNADRQPSSMSSSGGGCGQNAFQAFRLSNNIVNKATGKTTDAKTCEGCKAFNAGGAALSFAELQTAAKEDLSDITAQALRAALVSGYGKEAAKGKTPHCDGVVLPFEFSFTLDGIGGFIFGQLVTCDRIPQAVRDAFNFQVTAVEQNITAQDWTTTVNTVARFKAS